MRQSHMSSVRLQGVILFIVCAGMFWWRLGVVGLIDPDEPFYAQTTREMVQAGDWFTARIFGEPQFEKPIMFYWQSMAAQKLFGDNAFAARVPSAVFSTLLVFLTWVFGRRFLSPVAGFFSALILATGVEYAFMARLMLTDISLAFFVCASVFCFWMATQDENKRDRWMVLCFVASGFATLTKGPVGLLVPALGSLLYIGLSGTQSPWRGPGLMAGIAAWLLITVPWYAFMFAKFGREYWNKFFVHENWERLVSSEHDHNNHFWYYPMILTVGSLPWIPLLAATVMRVFREVKTDKRVLFVVCWVVPNLVFFTIVQSKLPTYTFFLFIAMALLMGQTLAGWVQNGFRGRAERLLVAILAVVQAAVVFGAAGWIGHLVPSDSNAFIKDLMPFVYAGSAMLAVPMVLMLAKRIQAWAGATACASLGIFVLAFCFHANQIEEYASTRGIAGEAARQRRPDEPVVTASFLARAVTYYMCAKPSGVVFLRSRDQRRRKITQPYFSPHPLNILLDEPGLAKFAAGYQSILCITQARDLERLSAQGSPLYGKCDKISAIGDRVLFRVSIGNGS